MGICADTTDTHPHPNPPLEGEGTSWLNQNFLRLIAFLCVSVVKKNKTKKTKPQIKKPRLAAGLFHYFVKLTPPPQEPSCVGWGLLR
ncbi:MAG: hypothetical protein RL020_526 [Pseudomonadota bacterium]|jgi:hypothetical protein